MGARIEPDTSRDGTLARVSKRTGIPFEVLAERFDRGLRGKDLTLGARPQPSANWLTTAQAAEFLATTSQMLPLFDQVDRLERRVRSYRARTSARGNGWLWARHDLERVMRIRRECQINVGQAIRVLVAIKEGRI